MAADVVKLAPGMARCVAWPASTKATQEQRPGNGTTVSRHTRAARRHADVANPDNRRQCPKRDASRSTPPPPPPPPGMRFCHRRAVGQVFIHHCFW